VNADRPFEIHRSRKARDDLAEIWLYIAERNQDAADRVLDEIDRVCRLIATRPQMGRHRPEIRLGIRSFGVMSWIVFYCIGDGFIDVVPVLHGARDVDASEI
jgi:toxin ParE1/3/4